MLQAEATLAAAQQDLMLRVAQAYFDVLLAQDNVALSEAQKSAISEQLAQAKRNFEVGTATIVDTLEAQASYDQAVAKEISDKNDLEVKRRALQVLIGKMPERPHAAARPARARAAEAQRHRGVGEVGARRRASRWPSRAPASRSREQEVDRQRAGHLPTLDLSGSLRAHRTIRASASSPPALADRQRRQRRAHAVGADLRGRAHAVARCARRWRCATAPSRTSRTRSAPWRSPCAPDFLNVTNGIAQVRALEQALVSTQSQLDSTILGRDVGVRTSVDVLNAQQQVFQTRRDLQSARYSYLLNTLRLKAAAGALAEADLEEVNRALAR